MELDCYRFVGNEQNGLAFQPPREVNGEWAYKIVQTQTVDPAQNPEEISFMRHDLELYVGRHVHATLNTLMKKRLSRIPLRHERTSTLSGPDIEHLSAQFIREYGKLLFLPIWTTMYGFPKGNIPHSLRNAVEAQTSGLIELVKKHFGPGVFWKGL